jgi:hypothetical protein
MPQAWFEPVISVFERPLRWPFLNHSRTDCGKLPVFYGTRSSIAVIKEPATGLNPEQGESGPHTHKLSSRSILILSSHLRLVSQMVSSLWNDFPPRFVLVSHVLDARYMSSPSHLPWFDHLNYICWRVKVMKLLSVQLSQVLRYFLSLRYKWRKHIYLTSQFNIKESTPSVLGVNCIP